MTDEEAKRYVEAAHVYYENQRRFPIEELAKYYGQHVAWSADGSQIVAGGKSRQELDQRLDELNIDRTSVVHGYVDEPDAVYVGGLEI